MDKTMIDRAQPVEIDVLIIGGTPLLRHGLMQLLQGDGLQVACSTGLAEAVDPALRPRLIIVDSGTDDPFLLCARLLRSFPSARLVLLADDARLEDVARGFGAGIAGYVVRTTPCEAMAEAIKLVMMGEKFMPATAFDDIACLRATGQGAIWQADAGGGRLSEREVEILACLARGEPNKRIAWHLDIAEATVKVHIKAILRKLALTNRTQAAIWAIGHGLTGAPPEGAAGHPANGVVR
jgi:two-component system nitrate/nitrite response regulator NarL